MKRPTLHGSAAAWLVPLACECAALLRSVILARLLGPEELGKVMILALALRLVEMTSDFSIERLMAQAPDGGSTRFQRAMHGAALLRGGALAVIVLVISLPMALVFSGGPQASSFALLALAPVMRGLVHLDYRRWERGFDYRGLLIVEGGAAAVMLAVTPLAAFAIADHRALIPVVLAQGVAQLVLSHRFARRRWRLSFERKALSRLISFGTPLLANSVLMFLTFHADRMIIAGFYDWADVGRYCIALQLALLPAQIAGRAAASLLAPTFRRALAADNIHAASAPAIRGYILLGAAFLLGYGLLAEPVIILIYGPDFAIGGALIWALGAAAAVRIARTPLSQLAVALGRTGVPARANLLRASAVLFAFVAAWSGAPLAAMAAAGAIGEVLAALRASALLRSAIAPRCSHSRREVAT